MGALFMPLTRMFNVAIFFWQGKKRFDIQAKYSFIINFFEAAAIILAILLTRNLLIIFAAYFISRFVFRAIVFCLTSKQADNQKTDEETIPFAKHLTLMISLGKFAGKIDQVIIWQMLGPIAVAIYSFAKLPIDKATSLIPIDSLALPKLSEQDITKIKHKLFKKFLIFTAITIPIAAIFALLVPYVFKILFPEYIDAIPYAQVLSLSFILIPFSLIQTALVANAKTKELYVVKIIAPILKIALFFILIPMYQLWGVIAAILGSQAITGIITLYLFKRV